MYSNLGTVSGPILFDVGGGATVDFGTSALSGTGTFTLSEGAVGQFGSPDGISAVGKPGAALGNIRVSAFRTYSPLGYYFCTGSTAQNMGSGLPTVIGTTSTAINAGGLGIDNAITTNTVSLTRPLLLHGELLLASGRRVSTPSAMLTLSTSAFLNDPASGSAESYVQGVMARELDGL